MTDSRWSARKRAGFFDSRKVYPEGDGPLLYRWGKQKLSQAGSNPLLSASGGCQGCAVEDASVAGAQPGASPAYARLEFYDIYKKEAASRRLLKVETVGVEPMTS